MEDGESPKLDCETPVAIEHAQGAGGHRLTYRVWRPSGQPRGNVVLLNGIMSHSGWFFPLVDPLVEAGLTVVGADRRGSGLDDVERGDAPSAHAIVEDALAVIDATTPADRPLYLVGWCWGTVLALNLVRPLKERLTGFVMVAPGLFPSQAVSEAAAEHEAEASAAAEHEPAILTPIAEEMFTDGPYLDAFIRTEPRRLLRITPRFRQHMTKLSMGALARLRRLDVPVLVLLAEGDRATDNAAVERALAKVDPERLTRRSTPSGHGMQFDVPDFVTGEIAQFVDRLSPRA